MRKIILLFLACLILFSGCKPKNTIAIEPSYQYVIGVSQANLVEPWRIALYEEIKAEGDKQKNTRFVFSDAAGDSARQIQDVEHLIGLGIDLLIISPNEADELEPIISKVHEQIPVIVLDRDIKGGDYDLFIGSDNKLIGTLSGERISKLLGDKGGNVLEIAGNKESPPAQEISQGFAEALEINPNITVVGVLDGDWLRDTAEMRMKDFLIKSENVDVVFAHNDAMALGASIAAGELRVSGIDFIGVDGLENEGALLVKKKVLVATFFRHTGGKEAVEWSIRILNGEKNREKRIILDPIPIL